MAGFSKIEIITARRREASRKHYLANRDEINAKATARQRANRELARAAYKKWALKNGPYNAERVAARRAGLKRATPAWVDRQDIRYVYEMAALFGVTVDHIHPLRGKNFSGLHVPWNLQLMPGVENSAKGNRLVGL